MTDDVPLLACEGIVKRFELPSTGIAGRHRGRFDALRGVSLALAAGESLGLVGESGCGKSTLARVLGLLYRPDAGSLRLRGAAFGSPNPFSARARAQRRALRRSVQMVFQDPFSSLNPRLRVLTSLTEPLRIHQRLGRTARRDRASEALHEVELDSEFLDRYPHELSGGQRQRIAIARALIVGPEMIIADEPISALDVTVQARVLQLLRRLRAERGLAYLFISHDLAAVDQICERVAVMYFGQIIEVAAREHLFSTPRHPYTRDLIDAVPTLTGVGANRAPALEPQRPPPRSALGPARASAELPSIFAPPRGCAYHPRCARASERCTREAPALAQWAPGAEFACHHPLPISPADMGHPPNPPKPKPC